MISRNIFDEFRKIDSSYYGIEVLADSLFSDKISDGCYSFINDHFKCGSKGEVINLPFDYSYETKGKHFHTVSLYLIGLLGEKIFSNYLKERLGKLMDVKEWYDFKYTWFLTCMYHDIASCIEKTQVRANSSERKKQLDFYLGMYNIQFTPYNYQPLKKNVCLTRFSEELIKNYFCYRMDSNSFDHGIIGGYLLFDKFYKNFIKKTEGVDWQLKYFETQKGLKWRREHIDHSAYIADAIICHNIWLCYKDSEEETYEEYGLNPLIVDSNPENKLSFAEYPLQFMLCLLDTIEPVKRFEDLKPQEVLELINVEFQHNGLKIEWDSELEKQKQFEYWKNGIIGLKNWMNVEVEPEEYQQITVSFEDMNKSANRVSNN